jgi:hypothetical protein
MRLGGRADFYILFYLESCIWPDVISYWIRQKNSECASNIVWRCNLLVQGYHWWWELDLQLGPCDKATLLPMEKGQTHWDRKGRVRWISKSGAYSSFSLTSKWYSQRICPARPSNQFVHITVTSYGDCMKMWEDFAPNFGNKRTGSCITITCHLTLPFSPDNFLPRTI